MKAWLETLPIHSYDVKSGREMMAEAAANADTTKTVAANADTTKTVAAKVDTKENVEANADTTKTVVAIGDGTTENGSIATVDGASTADCVEEDSAKALAVKSCVTTKLTYPVVESVLTDNERSKIDEALSSST